MDEVEPPFAGYRRTEQALARYIELARTDDGEKLPAVTKPIEPGQSYLGVPRLARFLRLVGDLPAMPLFPATLKPTAGRWPMRSNTSSAATASMTMAASVPPLSNN